MKIVFIGCRDINLLGGIESYMYKKTENLGMSTIDIIANEIEKELNKNEQV